MSRNSFLQNRRQIWSLNECNLTWTYDHLVCKQTLNRLAKLAKLLSCVVSTYPYVAFDCYNHVSYMLQGGSTLYSFLNVKELVAQSRFEILRLCDCNWTGTRKDLLPKRTCKYLAKLAKWLSCVVSIYLYGAFDSILLSCHVRVSEWLQTL